MDTIIGIDLGTTNSAVSVIRDGLPVMLPATDGQPILPSVVGLDGEGRLLVGQAARNQYVLTPERTVKSVKRQMGQDVKLPLGPQAYTPQEISAMILRTLKEQAERALGHPVRKAVITVPAFFNETQREATRAAGDLADLEVVRIINEPTAAALVYEPRSDRHERLLVYDLGGGTFDVSVVQIEQGVIEVLSSHGDTQLGGDDFDELLLVWVCEDFLDKHGLDLRELPTARSRLLQAVEEAKKRLSVEAYTELAEEFIAEKDGLPLNLKITLERRDYEELIEPLLNKTVKCVDAALHDARLRAEQIDKVILVGGSSRTPLVHRLLLEQLGQPPHFEIDPDLCVAMGAAVQGGLVAGIDVGAVLVDITPHTLGIECVGPLHGVVSPHLFSPIIERNTPLPATRSEIYYTGVDGQEKAQIHVLQGEDEDARHNQSVGKFMLEGLDEDATQGNEVLVRFELNLDGILTVTAVERATSLEKKLTIDNSLTQFRAKNRDEAKTKLASMFGVVEAAEREIQPLEQPQDAEVEAAIAEARSLLDKSRKIAAAANDEDADEIREFAGQLEAAIGGGSAEEIREIAAKLEDLVFYLEDA
ncbi:MAG: Hsp70 family protein [Candidatus Anammoximicrobium sp.]|nr:Hsp70 family protein [Candidatus Anammoximicrobium sp.]